MHFRKNDEITISYVPLISGEPLKTEHIKNEWNFECQCPRCQTQDILSEVICSKCHNYPLVYPTGIEKLTKPWRCLNCEATFSAHDIKKLVTYHQNELR